MFGITFVKIMVVLMVAFVLAQVFFIFKFKREGSLSDFDKSLWQFKLLSFLFGGVLLAAAVFFPISGWYTAIDLTRSSPEVALGDLVRNQERMGNQLHEFRDMFSLVLMIAGGYVVNVTGIIGKLQRERRKNNIVDDPSVRKPLGLDTE